jgi:hypothetical protein
MDYANTLRKHYGKPDARNPSSTNIRQIFRYSPGGHVDVDALHLVGEFD